MKTRILDTMKSIGRGNSEEYLYLKKSIENSKVLMENQYGDVFK